MSRVIDLQAFRRGRAMLCASEPERCVLCWGRDPSKVVRAVAACEACGAGLCVQCFGACDCGGKKP